MLLVSDCSSFDFSLFTSGEYPKVTEVFVHERDLFLAYSLKSLVTPGIPKSIVGVVGIGHVPGITKNYETVSLEDFNRISKVPPPSMAGTVTVLLVKTGFLSLLAYGGYRVVKAIASR